MHPTGLCSVQVIDMCTGIITYTGRPASACWRVQHQAGGRVYHPSDVREGECQAVGATTDLTGVLDDHRSSLRYARGPLVLGFSADHYNRQ